MLLAKTKYEGYKGTAGTVQKEIRQIVAIAI